MNRLLVRALERMGDAYRATLVEEETKNDMPPDEIELARSGERVGVAGRRPINTELKGDFKRGLLFRTNVRST